MDRARLKDAIEEAKEIVSDEKEPFKLAAFQVVLTKLISEEPPSIADKRASGKHQVVKEESVKPTKPKIKIPKEVSEIVLGLEDSEKILVVWSYSDTEWMGLGEFLSAAKEIGITLGASWSGGGNFNNRLYRKKQFFVKRGKAADAKYRLSDVGKKEVQRIISSKKSLKMEADK